MRRGGWRASGATSSCAKAPAWTWRWSGVRLKATLAASLWLAPAGNKPGHSAKEHSVPACLFQIAQPEAPLLVADNLGRLRGLSHLLQVEQVVGCREICDNRSRLLDGDSLETAGTKEPQQCAASPAIGEA